MIKLKPPGENRLGPRRVSPSSDLPVKRLVRERIYCVPICCDIYGGGPPNTSANRASVTVFVILVYTTGYDASSARPHWPPPEFLLQFLHSRMYPSSPQFAPQLFFTIQYSWPSDSTP